MVFSGGEVLGTFSERYVLCGRHQQLRSAASRNLNRQLSDLVPFLFGIRHLGTRNYGAQCLHTFIGNLVHLVPLLTGIQNLGTKNYGAQCLEILIVNLVLLVPLLVSIRHLDIKNYREQCLETLIGILVHLVPFLICIRHVLFINISLRKIFKNFLL